MIISGSDEAIEAARKNVEMLVEKVTKFARDFILFIYI